MSIINSERKSVNDPAAQKRHLKWLMVILVILSITIISARIFMQDKEMLAGGDSLWRLSINISTLATSEQTEIKISPPFDTPFIRTIERNVSFPGFKVRKSTSEKKQRRNFVITARDSGPHNISAEYLLHLSQTQLIQNVPIVELSTQQREKYLKDNAILQFHSYAVKETLNKLLADQPTQIILTDKIFDLLKQFAINRGKNSENVPHILSQKKATPYDRSIAMVALCRAAGIPARLVSGIILEDNIEPQPHYWVETLNDSQWFSYDILYGYKKSVPANHLPLTRNEMDIVRIINGKQNQVEYDLDQEFNHPYLRKLNNNQFSAIFDLARLPVDIRNELAILLLLPLGALITALFRHLIGLHSYGVFTPTLLALALVYANFITTFIVFIVVITLAVAGRSMFPPAISRIPRLSIIFTLIAFILTLSVSILNYFNIEQDGKVFLLPIIILTSLVDRFYSTLEDKGLNIAMVRMGWTIIITLLCLPVIQFETLGHLILNFPEIHLITLASFLLISLYKGKHLIQIPYLKILAEPDSSKK